MKTSPVGWVDCGVGGPVEHLAALAWDVFAGSDGHEEFARGCVFVYFVADVVDEPEVVFMVGGDAVGAHEPGVPELEAVAVWVLGGPNGSVRVVVAPHVDDVSVGVEDEDGDVSAVEDVDAVVGVDGYCGGFSEPNPVGDFCPSGDGFVVSDVVVWERQGWVSPWESAVYAVLELCTISNGIDALLG